MHESFPQLVKQAWDALDESKKGKKKKKKGQQKVNSYVSVFLDPHQELKWKQLWAARDIYGPSTI